ncbi:Epsin-1 [Acipenser ruthenus]|uniref:Epsin-1 n=1 Tax=Acipenser ruthenus TaxID=7906 RepID=A0A444UT96_ACIRT|nr:Epsin-1 [Acipenser ruthenus]
MSTSSLRRQVKNIVHNYSEAEIKVREATSNDPWGPSSSLMSEIADLTYNVVAFSEIMSMVWKRLNDHGKNWRHVYKAMTLMEYLIKTGSERVAQQCRENIYAVQTLKDFQYIDRDGKDQGVNVREKAKQLVTLLKDEERLKEERVHALKTKEKMGVSTSTTPLPSSRGVSPNPFSSSPPPPSSSSLNLSQLSQFNQQQQQQLRTSPLPPPLSMGMVQPGAPPLSMGMVQPGVPPLSMGMVQPGFPYPTVSPLGGPGGPILIGAPHMMMGMPVGLPPPSMTSLPSNNQTSTGGGASSTNPFLL